MPPDFDSVHLSTSESEGVKRVYFPHAALVPKKSYGRRIPGLSGWVLARAGHDSDVRCDLVWACPTAIHLFEVTRRGAGAS